MLEVIGVTDLIAANRDDYLRIAGRLAGDAGWRNEIREQITRAQSRLFDDPSPIERLQTFLQEAVVADRRA